MITKNEKKKKARCIASIGNKFAAMLVAAVQIPVGGEIAVNLAKILRALDAAAAAGVQITCFPECALTGYTPAHVAASLPMVPAAISTIAARCAAVRVAAVVGTACRVNCEGGVGVGDDDPIENVAVVIDEAGRTVGLQSKLQLVPTDSFARAGRELCTFALRGVVCSIIICHDSRHPELVTRLRWMLVPDSILRAAHRRHMILRACARVSLSCVPGAAAGTCGGAVNLLRELGDLAR